MDSKINPSDGATLDLIIPFLINSHFDPKSQPNRKQPKLLQESRQQTPKINRSSELAKIYAVNRGHSKTTHKFSPFCIDEQYRKAAYSEFRKNQERQSNEFKSTPKPLSESKKKSLHFFKVKSLSKGLTQVGRQTASSKRMALTQQQQKGAIQQILGIKFKGTHNVPSTHQQEESSQTQQSQPEQFTNRSPFFQKARTIRERKMWTKKRSQNVDAIVTRNCVTFDSLLQEYKRRMELPLHSRVFVFDSPDIWLRRALLGRGWVQNKNRHSKAFHLAWRSKADIAAFFEEQTINHYTNGHLLTSKAGLFKILQERGLSHLQPPTFDLNFQRQLFEQKYQRYAFMGALRRFLSFFMFEKGQIDVSKEQVQGILNQEYRAQTYVQKLLRECVSMGKFVLRQKSTHFDSELFTSIKNILSHQQQASENTMQMVRALRSLFHYLSGSLSEEERCLGGENIWILKSRNSSKGAGLMLTLSLSSILKQSSRLVQKYIERPLIFQEGPHRGRKFDVRVWVLMVGSPNARLFYHGDFYGKVSTAKYSLHEKEQTNERIHLTNFTTNKPYFHGREISTSVITPTQLFQGILQEKHIEYEKIFHKDIRKLLNKLKPILVDLIAPQSHGAVLELFGLDFVLDEALRLHFLEVNLSPSCAQRHPYLTQMLDNMADGIINLVQDPLAGDVRGWIAI